MPDYLKTAISNLAKTNKGDGLREALASICEMYQGSGLRSAILSINKIHQNMEPNNPLTGSTLSTVLQQISQTMEPIHRQQDTVCAALKLSEIMNPVQNLLNANQRWQEIVGKASEISNIAAGLAEVNQSWSAHLKANQESFRQLATVEAHTKLALCDVSLLLVAAQPFWLRTDFEAIRKRYRLEKPAISELKNSVINVAASYGILAESFSGIEDIKKIPEFVLPGATREIYTTEVAIEALHPSDTVDDEDSKTKKIFTAQFEQKASICIDLIEQLDPQLVKLYLGAREALTGDNVDRERHILVSWRELWNQLLRRIAPEELVLQWISTRADQKDTVHNGRPTRRAKVLYLCQNLCSHPLENFVRYDIELFLSLLDVFNRIHSMDPGLNEAQLRAIVLKSELFLMYILQIWEGNLSTY